MRSLKPGALWDVFGLDAFGQVAFGRSLPDDISIGDGWKVGIAHSGKVTLLRMEHEKVVQAKNLTGEIAAAIHAAGEVGADLVVVNIVRRHLGLPEVDQEPPRVPGPTAHCAVLCPYCEGYCECEEVDIGVGHQQVTPYICGNCGAEQMGPYDTEGDIGRSDTRRVADAEELHNRWWKGWAVQALRTRGKQQPQ